MVEATKPPEGWGFRKLCEIAEIFTGGTPSTKVAKYWNGNIFWCVPSDITTKKGKYLDETERKITQVGLKNSAAKILPEGTLLLCSRATIGDLKISKIKVTTNQGFKALVCSEEVDNEFVYYQLLTLKNNLIEKAVGTTFLEISKKDTGETEILIPLLKKEQSHIAQVLADLDILVDSLDRLIVKKKLIKQGVMQELLTGKKRLSGDWQTTDGYNFGEITKIPKAWKQFTLNSLCKSFTKQTGFDYSASIKRSLVESPQAGAIPFIQNKDFYGKKINFNTDYYIPEQVANRFPAILLDEKCLLISISGSIGNVGIFSNEQKAFIGGAIAVAKFRNKQHLEWVMYYLLSDMGQNTLFRLVKAGAQHNLILDDLRKIIIPLPIEKEQAEINEILSEMDLEIEALECKRDKCRLLKVGLMQQLLTGRIRLKCLS